MGGKHEPEECLMGESMNRRNALWGKHEPKAHALKEI